MTMTIKQVVAEVDRIRDLIRQIDNALPEVEHLPEVETILRDRQQAAEAQLEALYRGQVVMADD